MIEYNDGVPSEDLVRLQQVLRDMAVKFLDYCAAHDLPVFLAAGTALGACRSGGFIPWDDDLDLGMLRSDFSRLVQTWDNDPIPGIFLQCRATEPAYHYSFAKLRLDGTYLSTPDFDGTDMHCGIFVDIFPFDAVPSIGILSTLQRYAIGLTNLFIDQPPLVQDPDYHSPRRKRMRRIAAKLKWFLPDRAFVALREFLTVLPGVPKGDEVDCFGMFGASSHYRTRIAAKALVPPVPVKFAGIDAMVPADPDAYLTRMYRNWRSLPPEHQRVPGHGSTIDFGDA